MCTFPDMVEIFESALGATNVKKTAGAFGLVDENFLAFEGKLGKFSPKTGGLLSICYDVNNLKNTIAKDIFTNKTNISNCCLENHSCNQKFKI